VREEEEEACQPPQSWEEEEAWDRHPASAEQPWGEYISYLYNINNSFPFILIPVFDLDNLIGN